MTGTRSTDPAGLLCELLLQGDQRIAAGAYGGLHAPAVATLVQAGLLAPNDVTRTTICDVCEELHIVDVEFNSDNQTHGWRCPEAGWVEASETEVAALIFGVGNFAEKLSEAFSRAFARRPVSVREADTSGIWIIGVWTISGIATRIVLARDLYSTRSARRTRETLLSLSPLDAGLVLTVEPGADFEPVREFTAVALEEAVSIDGQARLSLHVPMLDGAVAALAAKRSASHVGRPGLGPKILAILEHLAARGEIDGNSNGIPHLVELEWRRVYSKEEIPGNSTLRKYIRYWREFGA